MEYGASPPELEILTDSMDYPPTDPYSLMTTRERATYQDMTQFAGNITADGGWEYITVVMDTEQIHMYKKRSPRI